MVILFATTIGLSFLTIMLFIDAASYAVDILSVVTPACVAVMTCYFGKAGFENYNKYKKTVTSTSSDEDEDEDSSNG